MKSSKLTPIFILLAVVTLLGVLSFPIQAKAGPAGSQQNNVDLGRGATNTKKPKNTPPPRRTATPRPANTATRAVGTNPGTAVVTQIVGSPISTLNGSPTVPPTANPLFSPTPTSLGMSTIAAQQTATVNASYLTSTAVARLYSPTPTSLGAEKLTPVASSDVTSLSMAMTTTPAGEFSEAMIVTSTIAFSPTPLKAQLNAAKPQQNQPAGSWYWIVGAGAFILLSLMYLLYREWKKTSLVVNNNQK